MFLSTRNPFSSPVIVDPEQKEVNVVCIGKQNHNILYDKMKLLVSVATCENAKKTVKLQARTREEHVVVLV